MTVKHAKASEKALFENEKREEVCSRVWLLLLLLLLFPLALQKFKPDGVSFNVMMIEKENNKCNPSQAPYVCVRLSEEKRMKRLRKERATSVQLIMMSCSDEKTQHPNVFAD